MFNKLHTKKIKISLNSIINKLILKYEMRSIHKKKVLGDKFKKFAIFKHDQNSHHINLLDIYEKDELDTVFSFFLKNKKNEFKKKIALDIGAYLGNHSIYFSKYFKEVYSFEPNKSSFQLLKFNVSFYNNIKVFNFGLFNKSKTLNLKEVNYNLAGSSFKIDKYKHKKNERAKVYKFDNLKFNKKIALIKIDTERCEYEVLKGSEKTLKKNRPLILFEQSKDEFKNNTTKSIDFLKKNNYRILYINKKNYFFLIRFLKNIYEFFFGRQLTILESDFITKNDYSFLIAIPLKNK